MKRKFSLHLDAIIVLSLLFMLMLGLSVFLQSQVSTLTKENKKLQWQSLEDSFNLSSQQQYIKKLEAQLAEIKKPLSK